MTETLALLDKPVSDLKLRLYRTRILNVLNGCYGYSGKVITLGQLVVLTPKQLLKRRNFGKACLNELTAALNELGLDLGMELPRFIGQRVPVRSKCEKCNTPTNWVVDVSGRLAYWCGCGN
jgi:DNA-directed RNA polymerase alpha subunit